MRKPFAFAALLTACLVVPASTTNATPPTDVVFEVETTIPGDGPAFGPFTASGPAVDAGLMCPSGDTVDLIGKFAGTQSPTGFNILVVKVFTCDDGSGDFVVKMQVRFDRKGDNFRWVVMDGTGEYERLHGTGDGSGFPFTGGVFDVFSGGLHID